jgi:DNA polymerase-4
MDAYSPLEEESDSVGSIGFRQASLPRVDAGVPPAEPARVPELVGPTVSRSLAIMATMNPPSPAEGPDAPPVGCFLYLDCDRFFFAVEASERPGLASDPRPVIIGRDPREAPRGIVTTANDAARALGIRSGMSAAIAAKLAPDALFLPPRHAIYAEYSERVMALVRAESPLVERRSIDEAVCEWPHGFRREPATTLRARLLAETRISVSLGIATSPLVAKMASEVAKSDPDHLCVVTPGAEAAWLAPMPVRALIGVGPKTESRLHEAGITTIGAIADRSVDDLVRLFGRSWGQYLHVASQGIDHSVLESDRASKSVSAEHTFPTDITDTRLLWSRVRAQAAEVSLRLREEALEASEVGIKLRYSNRETITRQAHLGVPTGAPEVLARVAAKLIARHWDRRRAIRLIGVRAARLSPRAGVSQLPLPYERPGPE